MAIHRYPSLIAASLVAVSLHGCGQYSIASSQESDDRSHTGEGQSSAKRTAKTQTPTCLGGDECAPQGPTPTPAPSLAAACTLPEGVSASFRTTKDMVALINAMPKPLSLACFLEVLPDTHRLAGSSSGTSAQPAYNSNNPRLFIETGDMLLGVVPDGPDKNFLEFSMLISSNESVKGEIEFPVKENIDPLAPFQKVLNPNKTSTKCGLCHVNESDSAAQYGAGSFVSRALRPSSPTMVPIFELQRLAERCKDDPSERCRIWRAAFKAGKTAAYMFPAEMPILGQP